MPGKIGKRIMQDMKEPRWRRFEAASPREREGMVDWYEIGETPDGKGVVRRDPIRGGLYIEPSVELEDLCSRLKSLRWRKVIRHHQKWFLLRASFYRSEEWKRFRLQWLQDHPACVRCGRTDGILQVHHAGHYNLDHTVMEEGFLEGLKHPERFETLCQDCHYKEHENLIAVEEFVGVRGTPADP